VLQRRLSTVVLAAGALIGLAATAGCGATPVDDPLVRPGISAIDRSTELACDADAATLRSAIDTYTLLEGTAPADEATLIPDFLREESTNWDVVDGRIVAENPACGEVGAAAPTPTTIEIVTEDAPISSDDASITAEQFLASMTPDEIDTVGGLACADELARIYAAGARFLLERQAEPASIDDLVEGGFLDAPPKLWELDGDELVPVDGSGCTAFASASAN